MSAIRLILVFLLILASGLAAGMFTADDFILAGDPPPCAFDDGFEDTGNCCALTGASLPIAFPAAEQEIRYFTWNNCNLARNKTLCVELSALEFARDGEGDVIGCGTYKLPVSMLTCGQQALPLFSGELIATYSRTWVEKQPTEDPDTQVWRFMINGDLAPSSFVLARYGDNPHLPQCQATYAGLIHWFGYIDYRRDCSTLEWETEWVLEHACDRFHHDQGSLRTGTYHPGRSFNFAGPSTFTPTTDYSIFDLDVRDSSPGLRKIEYNGNDFARCYRYENFHSTATFTLDPECACGVPGEEQYIHTQLDATTSCISEITAPAIRKKLGYFEHPEFGILRRITMWVGPSLFVDECAESTRFEYLEGVEVLSNRTENFKLTESGDLVPLGATFVDLASSNDDTGGPLQGVPHFSRLHINLNR